MITHEIIATITRRRRELGLTQAELAARARISRRSIIDLENGMGKHDIGIRKLLRLLDSLGLQLTMSESKARPTESELRDLFGDDDDE